MLPEIVFDYTLKQIVQIRQGGPPVFYEKVKRRSIMLLLVSLAMPFIVIVRLLRPLITIRFGKLRGERIGHFASNTEHYLCERDAGLHGKNYDFFYINGPICNDQLKKMWGRTLPISRFVAYLIRANLCIPGYKKHQILSLSNEIDIQDVYSKTQPHLSFTVQEERSGKQGLNEISLPDDTPFVCFIARDSAYLNSIFPGKNWDYHNYRDMNIKNFIPAVKELTQRGYYVIRMGSVVKESLNIKEPKYVDYATKYRTDFLDIYLSAKCDFFINSMSGFDAVPRVLFRRPMVQINFIPLHLYDTVRSEVLMIPKKLWHVKDRRFLTFRESFENGIGRILQTEQYKQAGIEPIENSCDDITAVVNEMEERISGVWQTTDEEEELQRRFNELFQTYKTGEDAKDSQIQIGSEFLRQNVKMLE